MAVVLTQMLMVAVLAICMGFSTCAVASDNSKNTIEGRNFDAKGMLTSLAGNLMSRGFVSLPGTTAAAGSQVVSLNLTNLVVLILLKALIFAAGSLGAGTWKGGFARSNDGDETLLSDEEILLFLSYLTGTADDNGCLQNIACQQPSQTKRYVAAGDMLLKTARMLAYQPDFNYDFTLQQMKEASEWGNAGGNCDRYICGANEKYN